MQLQNSTFLCLSVGRAGITEHVSVTEGQESLSVNARINQEEENKALTSSFCWD